MRLPIPNPNHIDPALGVFFRSTLQKNKNRIDKGYRRPSSTCTGTHSLSTRRPRHTATVMSASENSVASSPQKKKKFGTGSVSLPLRGGSTRISDGTTDADVSLGSFVSLTDCRCFRVWVSAKNWRKLDRSYEADPQASLPSPVSPRTSLFADGYVVRRVLLSAYSPAFSPSRTRDRCCDCQRPEPALFSPFSVRQFFAIALCRSPL